MPTPIIHQRCWNHEAREAVCRCPGCGRSYCRECVTEHDARLLCRSCLAGLAGATRIRGAGMRRMLPAAMALGGILLAWVVFYAAREAVVLLSARMERTIAEPER